ncbi:penicillin acylase family protein [Ekhidna sp.]
MARVKYILFFFLLFKTLLPFAQNPEEIEIMRDNWGVPHIYAPTDPQVAYGLAWAHAEDDFSTIQLTLLGAKQMLGRHLGKEGATVDYVVGLLRCEEIVETNLSKVSPEFMAIVEGYAAGINSYAKNHPDELFLKNAFPVTVKDIFKAYVLQLAVMDGADKVIKALFENEIPNTTQTGTGSNAIAISRDRTDDEYTYLAVNSHQPLEGPAAWYEAHLVSDEGWNMLGGLFPGGPVVFHGTNENLGWAHTVNYPDKIDVFELEINPSDKNLYKVDNEWVRLQSKKIKLKVKVLFGLKLGISKKAYHSIYGPVVKNDSGVFAFHMGVFDEIRAIEQWYEMNKATNLEEFKTIISDIRIPSFNIVYADRESNIFYVSNGLLPLRNSSFDWSTTLPGNSSKTKPVEYHSFKDLPQITNPNSGYLFNMNNAPFHATYEDENISFEDYDPTMGFVIRENNRSTRMKELMNMHSDKISWEVFKNIKYDAQLPDSLVYKIDINPIFHLTDIQPKKANDVLKIIQSWDRIAFAEKIGPAHLLLTYKYLEDKKIESPSKADFTNALSYTYDYLTEHFNRVNIKLGEYQKLVRGNKELPLDGIPDVITAMYNQPYKDGMVKGKTGESYIMMIRYPEEGLPIVETINVYGASNRSNSPHYNDQMDLFVERELKKMTLDIEEVRKNAKRVYHPK